MSGGQDEASERINTSDLPYWLAGPIKRLEARVERLEQCGRGLQSWFRDAVPCTKCGKIPNLKRVPMGGYYGWQLYCCSGCVTKDASVDCVREWNKFHAKSVPPTKPTDPPAKRREWWVVVSPFGAVKIFQSQQLAKDYLLSGVCGPEFQLLPVIAAPSEAEIEAAVKAGIEFWNFCIAPRPLADSIRSAIRKLLGGTS